MTEVDAYLAGLFDGEGWVSIAYHTTQDHYTLQIGVKMSSREAIEYLNSVYPGKVYVETRGEHGWLTMYKWVVNGAKAKPFIEAMLPYCKVKALPLQLALQYINTISSCAPKKLTPGISSTRAQLRSQLINYNKEN